MGAFFGSVQFRGIGRDAVVAAVEALAAKEGGRFLVGPELNGWVGVYPQGNGQDVTLAARLSKSLGGQAFALLVHDDDIFVYDYYRDGRLVDQYNSRPDYFEEVSARAKAKVRGRPERFAELAVDDARFNALKIRLAETANVVFASELLTAFADALGIANTTTAYEYLHDQEETDGIEGIDAFVHVPDLAAEKRAKRQAGEAMRERTEVLKRRGLLLFECGGVAGNLGGPSPHVAPDREGTGFLVAWSSATFRPDDVSTLERIGPPWAVAVASDLPLRSTVYKMAVSPSGRYLATGHASGDWKARAWDLEQGRQVAEATHSQVVDWVGFAAGETAMVSVGTELNVTPLVDGASRATWPTPRANTAAVHPREPVCVVADNQSRLALLDLADGRIDRTLFVGGQRVPSPFEVAHLAAAEQQVGQIDVDAVEKQLRAQTEQMFRMFEGLPLPPGASPDQLKEQIQAQLEEQIRQIRNSQKNPALMTAGARQERGSELVFRLAFDPEGRRLFAGTSGGVRVYDWAEVTRAERDTPRPIAAVDLHPFMEETRDGPEQRQSYVYDVALDPERDRLLFGGLDGQVRYLDLASGRSGVLLDLAGRPPIHALCLSRDRTALAIVADPDLYSQARRKRGPIVRFWNYPALCEQALRPGPED